jgi:hypothetical protein
MYNEPYLTNDCLPENRNTISIRSFDVAKYYNDGHQDMTLAVSVMNLCGEPVPLSDVEIILSSPGGFSFSLSESTDSSGVAIFELKRIARGRWEVIVFNIEHPEFEVDLSRSEKRWSVTYV